MIIPNSIPNWYEIIQKSKDFGLDFNINLDMFSGIQSGHIIYDDKNYAFRLEVFPKNMILSMKEFNSNVFVKFSETIDLPYRILYETETDYKFHGEWYFDCAEEDIINEMIKMVKSPNLKIIDLNQLNLY